MRVRMGMIIGASKNTCINQRNNSYCLVRLATCSTYMHTPYVRMSCTEASLFENRDRLKNVFSTIDWKIKK